MAKLKKKPTKTKKPLRPAKKKKISRNRLNLRGLIKEAVKAKAESKNTLDFIKEFTLKDIASKIEKENARIKKHYDIALKTYEANKLKLKAKSPAHRARVKLTPPTLRLQKMPKADNVDVEFLEFPPTCRTILVNQYDIFSSQNISQPYYLSLPYIQFYRFDDHLYVTCSTKSIKSLKDSVFYLPFPNAGHIFEDICLGSRDANRGIKIAANRYFTSSFNGERGEYIDFPKEIKHFRNWEKQTKLNNDFWKTVNWQGNKNAPITVEQFIDRIGIADYLKDMAEDYYCDDDYDDD